jgi:hypothetical protein
VTLRARWVTLRARWVTLTAGDGKLTSTMANMSLMGTSYGTSGIRPITCRQSSVPSASADANASACESDTQLGTQRESQRPWRGRGERERVEA